MDTRVVVVSTEDQVEFGRFVREALVVRHTRVRHRHHQVAALLPPRRVCCAAQGLTAVSLSLTAVSLSLGCDHLEAIN